MPSSVRSWGSSLAGLATCGLLGGLTASACGGVVVFEDGPAGDTSSAGAGGGTVGEAPAPLALYVSTRDACGVEASVSEAAASLTTDEGGGDMLFVVDLAFIDECSGAGGQHILARAVDGSREMWVGGHTCRFFDDALVDGALRAGLARAWQTAGLHFTSADACVTFPDEAAELTTDVQVQAIAVFRSHADARAFAEAESLD